MRIEGVSLPLILRIQRTSTHARSLIHASVQSSPAKEPLERHGSPCTSLLFPRIRSHLGCILCPSFHPTNFGLHRSESTRGSLSTAPNGSRSSPPLRGPTRSDPRRSIPCPRFIGIFGKDIDRLSKGIEGGGFMASPFADPRLLRACTSSGFSRRFRTSFRPFRLVRRVLERVLGWRQVERAPLRISCAGSAANA